LIWVVIGSVVALLLCGGVVAASYIVYQRGGEVAAPVADSKGEATACTDAGGLKARLIPAQGSEKTFPAGMSDDDVVVTLQAGFAEAPVAVVKDALTSLQFVCGAVREWTVGSDWLANVQLLQFESKDDALNYYISRVLPLKDGVAATDLAYVNGIEEGFVVTRSGKDGQIHAMGFTTKGAVLVVAEMHGKKRPDSAAVGDLLRQQLEKA
jgi:hypothetical protein